MLLPVLFHSFGLGSVFLPLLFPIALGAFFLQSEFALAVGILGPLLSALLTGMPPFSPPIAQVMMCEGGVLGGATAWLNRIMRKGILPPLISGIILSRITLLMLYGLMLPLLGLPGRSLSVAAIISGLPGIILQILIIPIIVNRIKKQKIIGE